ncbi:superfamily II DNA/RNA helicase [Paraperlucidibaca baekdonensis]|uniref:DEAD-box ATP-dependent RNA helicase RhpA n=1 Tax=Paraperlucidibaca baekdonensis TaxID=748120 RepID=A0A3E0H385_9GAMM|nr:DEAD/DEAH box helicase [Paraperlucidibaca baekdonensis]REH37769.1 superfamily II DNA/RNA helicase [Paraperlucidibaca baekdonensis]
MSLTFAALKLHDALLAALNEAGYTEPTPVQAQAIPIALEGKDLMASAQTGTGKTAAFILPALHRITQTPGGPGKGPRILVLTPTRELARQVESAARIYGARLRVRTASILGGMNYQQQARQLQRPVDVMVATPGRLLDLMNRGQIKLDRVEVLVLDEADRMLDLGFIDDVELIAEQAPAERQTLLFSATLENRIATLAERVMRNPERLQISAQTAKHENISQSLYFCDDMAHKKAILLKLLDTPDVNQSVVFTATRRDAEELSIELANYGLQTAALHGDMKQPARNRTLRALKDGGVRCLVATDVAARGIDVAGITHVFNFDLPMVLEDYVHRIGRTGRAGRTGTAISLVNRRDRGKLQRLAAYTGNAIPEATIPGMEPRPAPKYRDNGGGRPAGRGAPRREHGGGRDFNRDSRGPSRDSGRPAYSNDRPARSNDRPAYNSDRPARPAYSNDRPAYNNDRPARSNDGFAPRGDRPRSDRPAYANDRPRSDRGGFRDRAAAPRRDGPSGDAESIGNRAGVATHERSAFDRKAFRNDRPGFSRGGDRRPAGGDFRARSNDAPRRSYNDAPGDGASASRPQPQVRVIRSRDSRVGAASTAAYDDKR